MVMVAEEAEEEVAGLAMGVMKDGSEEQGKVAEVIRGTPAGNHGRIRAVEAVAHGVNTRHI